MVSSKDAFEEKTYDQPSGFSSSDYVPGRIHFLNWRHGPVSRICHRNERRSRSASLTSSPATALFFQAFQDRDMSAFDQTVVFWIRIALLGAIVVLGFCVTPGLLATISRNVDAEAAITAMWSMVRPALSLRNWLATLRSATRRRSVN
jgi:hypothetical protein